MNQSYQQLNETMGDLLVGMSPGGDCPNLERVNIQVSDLPSSVPSGSIARVDSKGVEHHLKLCDLLFIWDEGRYKLRRFIRQTRKGMVVAGDRLNEVKLTHFKGPAFKVKSLSHTGVRISHAKKPDFDSYVLWLQSLLLH